MILVVHPMQIKQFTKQSVSKKIQSFTSALSFVDLATNCLAEL